MISASQEVNCDPPAASPSHGILNPNGNNFNLEQYQNFESVIAPSQGTPLSPFNLLNPSQYRSMVQNSNNILSNIQFFTQSRSGGGAGGGGDFLNAQFFSPMLDSSQQIQLSHLNSPGILSNNQNNNNNTHQSNQQNNPNNFTGNPSTANQGCVPSSPFSEFDGNEFNAMTFAPHNISNNNFNSGLNLPFHQSSSSSFFRANSQRNTPLHPMACASPAIFQSSSQNKITNLMLTPKVNGLLGGNSAQQLNLAGSSANSSLNNIHNNNIFNNNNYLQNTYNQSGGSLHQQSLQSNSPHLRERLGSLISYEFYNSKHNEDHNDLFDDMDLKDWVDTNNHKSIKEGDEEDERSQSFHSQPHKKIKRDTSLLNHKGKNNQKNNNLSSSTHRNNITDIYQDDMNSCTQEDQHRRHSYASSTNKPQHDINSCFSKISSEKTVKQNSHISPCDNGKSTQGSITPFKKQLANNTLDRSYNYATPSTSRQKIKEEECSEEMLLNTTMQQSTILKSESSRQTSKEEKGGRNGLRILSEKVRDIVCELKETTYKQVAEHLIKDMEATKQNNLEFAKDEQNVKRRVYDALNVLIAANVLRKEGKKVKADHLLPKGNATQQNPHLKKEYLEKALILKRTRLVRKEETINDLITKLVALRCLCDRNQSMEKQVNNNGTDPTQPPCKSLKCITLNNSQKKPEEKDLSQRKLRFPFIGMYSPHNNQRISFKKFNNGLLISSIERMNLMGDIDILVRLYSTRSDQSIAQDKIKYLNPALVEYLRNLPKFQDAQPNGSQQEDEEGLEDSCEQQELQMEVTITNNKIIQQHLPNSSGSNHSNREHSNQFQQPQQQQQQQQSSLYGTQNNNNNQGNLPDSDTSSETVKQTKPSQNIVKNSQQMMVLPEFGEFEDSNQLVNEYID